MSLNKAIKHGKEKRKSFHRYPVNCCNNNGGCPWCTRDRFHSTKRCEDIAKDKMKEVEE